ncbi:sodium:proton antiporter, partial [Peribacillus sp. SIMBA_075]
SGRILFTEDWNIHTLDDKEEQGYAIRSTKLTERFTYEEFNQRWSSNTIPLFVETAQGNVEFFTSDKVLEPKQGDTIISFTGPERDS